MQRIRRTAATVIHFINILARRMMRAELLQFITRIYICAAARSVRADRQVDRIPVLCAKELSHGAAYKIRHDLLDD